MNKLLLLVLVILLSGCAGIMRDRANIRQTADGWVFSSTNDNFEASVESEGKKVSYSSVSPSMLAELTKTVTSVGASIGQLAIADKLLSN